MTTMGNNEMLLQQSDSVQNLTVDQAAAEYFRDRSEDNLEAVIHASRKLIGYFVKIYGWKQSQQDLIQAGNEGLLKALKRFNPTIGVSFATYAGSLISGEIRHCIRKENSYYQPRTVEKLQEKIDVLISEQLAETGEEPTLHEISSKVNIQEEGVKEVMKAGILSFDEIDTSKIVNIKAESFKLVIEDRIILEQAIKKLSDLQQKVVHMIFYKDMTQDQTAKELGINQKKVSRELAKSLDKMRDTIK